MYINFLIIFINTQLGTLISYTLLLTGMDLIRVGRICNQIVKLILFQMRSRPRKRTDRLWFFILHSLTVFLLNYFISWNISLKIHNRILIVILDILFSQSWDLKIVILCLFNFIKFPFSQCCFWTHVFSVININVVISHGSYLRQICIEFTCFDWLSGFWNVHWRFQGDIISERSNLKLIVIKFIKMLIITIIGAIW